MPTCKQFTIHLIQPSVGLGGMARIHVSNYVLHADDHEAAIAQLRTQRPDLIKDTTGILVAIASTSPLSLESDE